MPTRSFDLTTLYHSYDWVYSGVSPTCDGSQAGVSYPVFIKKGGVTRANTPNFHTKMVRNDLLPLNPYLRWDYQAQRSLGSHWRVYDAGSALCTQTASGFTQPGFLLHDGVESNYGILPDAWAEANVEALKVQAIANCSADLDALTTAAESHKTFQMIKNTRKDAKDLIVQALRGGRHTVRAAASAWLAWKYGWQQLGYDMQNIADFVNAPIKSHIVEGRAGVSPTLQLVIPPEDIQWSSGTVHREREVSIDASLRAHAVVRYYSRGLNVAASIPVTTWEMVPYSFVIDWFVNIGDVLRAWDVLLMARNVQVSLGEKYTADITSTATYGPPGSNPKYVDSGGSAFATERFTRKRRIPSSVPSLVPSLAVRLTGSRITDMAALLSKPIINSSFRR